MPGSRQRLTGPPTWSHSYRGRRGPPGRGPLAPRRRPAGHLAAYNRIGRSTAYRYPHENIDVLAGGPRSPQAIGWGSDDRPTGHAVAAAVTSADADRCVAVAAGFFDQEPRARRNSAAETEYTALTVVVPQGAADGASTSAESAGCQ